MNGLLKPAAVLLLVVVIGASIVTSGKEARQEVHNLTVHEWGTFTTVVGEDGLPISWRPLRVPSDLPEFIYSLGVDGRRSSERNRPVKGELRVKVRMETPVTYFYSDREMNLSVSVGFPRGYITEWYPDAAMRDRSIDWDQVSLLPRAKPELPVETVSSRYYHARETDSVPVRVHTSTGDQDEKFLFYRGAGDFDLPLSVKLEPNKINITNLSNRPIGPIYLFENKRGRISYSSNLPEEKTASIRIPAPEATLASIEGEISRLLISEGLYQKEARAMIETWRESWFEEGTRIFYVLPRAMADELIPLEIRPAPSETVRVMVGRTEIITPELEAEVGRAATQVSGSDPVEREVGLEVFRRYGRFLEPILTRVFSKQGIRNSTEQVQRLIGMAERSRS